jgi:hypothetical protein
MPEVMRGCCGERWAREEGTGGGMPLSIGDAEADGGDSIGGKVYRGRAEGEAREEGANLWMT